MRPLKFNVIKREKIDSLLRELMSAVDFSIFSSYVAEYERDRPDSLKNIDIFCEGERSATQTYNRFDLIENDTKSPTVLVSPLYLELFEFSGCGHYIVSYTEALSNLYPNQTVVFQWNHDNDFYPYSIAVEPLKNIKIINFGNNTYRSSRDIIVPFWNVSTTQKEEKKAQFSSFVGSVNNRTRHALASSIVNSNNTDLVYIERLPEEEYLSFLSSCHFSLCPLGGPGGSGFSYRFFECLHLNTVPVLMVNKLIFPYPDIDWNNMCLTLPEDYYEPVGIINILKSIQFRESFMLEYIKSHRLRFTLGGVQEEVYNNLT